jgi:hypothetical protein
MPTCTNDANSLFIGFSFGREESASSDRFGGNRRAFRGLGSTPNRIPLVHRYSLAGLIPRAAPVSTQSTPCEYPEYPSSSRHRYSLAGLIPGAAPLCCAA